MSPVEKVLYDLVRSFVQEADDVVITEVLAPAKCFEVKVGLTDYIAVMSQLNVIKILAMRFAGLPNGEDIIINLVVNQDQPSP